MKRILIVGPNPDTAEPFKNIRQVVESIGGPSAAITNADIVLTLGTAGPNGVTPGRFVKNRGGQPCEVEIQTVGLRRLETTADQKEG